MSFRIANEQISAVNSEAAPRKILPTKRYPTKASVVKATQSGGLRSNVALKGFGNDNEKLDVTNWFWEVPKLFFSNTYSYLDRFYVLSIALLFVALVYYSYSTPPGMPNSVRQGLSLSKDAGHTFKQSLQSHTTMSYDFSGPLAKWKTIFFVLLISAITLLSPRLVGVGAFLGLIAIAVFYLALWTTSSAISFVSIGFTIFYGYRKVWSTLFFLVVPPFAHSGNAGCFNAAVTSVITLVLIAISAMAMEIFVDFMKITCPTLIGLPFSILTWQPVLWAIIFWMGRYQNFVDFSPIEQLRTYWNENFYFFLFLVLATFKGTKLIVHTISYYLYTRPVQPLQNPTITPADVTVIVPTLGTVDNQFEACIRSILANKPARLIVSTVRNAALIQKTRACHAIDPRIKVISVSEPNKRAQLIAGVEMVRTPITIYADDSVFWPRTFLRSALAPFEDPIVGLVGTSKRVIRSRSHGLMNNFFNYISCIYLERHNFECTASYNIDGGVFVISGRTALARTSILQSIEYREKFQNEYFWGIGPMKVDDDNFSTRFMVNHGFKTVFQNDPRATITTTMGHSTFQLKRFKGQLMRWARTTWRSNLTSLLVDRNCYRRHPWTTYAMFLSSLSNFALFYDSGMFYLLWKSGSSYICMFVLILLLSKIIKPLPHLAREWRDWYFVPFGIMFGWCHSFIKAWAFLTMWNVSWSGRDGIKATA